jgi:glycosyltransferase involved in cell wall biosynthesis
MRGISWNVLFVALALISLVLLVITFGAPKSKNGRWDVWVITPCYNQEHIVPETIQSVMNQQFQNWFLLVLDDGSSGQSCLHAAQEEFQKLNIPHSKGKIIYQENIGVALTRVNAVKYLQKHLPKTDPARVLLCFLDADDLLTPEYLQNAVEHLNGAPDTELIYAPQLLVTKRPEGITRSLWDVPELDVEKAIKSNPLPILSLIRLDLYERLGGFPAEMVEGNEDYSFWLHCLEHGVKAHRLPMIGSHYLVQPDSRTRRTSYKAVALPMLKASHPGLFDNSEVSNALFHLFCGLELRQVKRLMSIIDLQPHNCNPVLWVWFYYIRTSNGGLNSPEAKTFQENLRKCLLNNNHNISSVSSLSGSTRGIEISSNLVPRFIFAGLTSSPVDITATSCQHRQTFFEEMLDEESLPLNMLRVTSLLGSFISESRSRPGATERPYNLFVITTPPDQGKDILLQYATTIPSLKIFPIIVSANDDDEKNSIETTAITTSSRISKFAHVDGLYMNVNGQEQSICSLLQSKKILQRIGFIATEFNKTALDRHGPLPATEFIARSFGDNGMTTVTAGGGSRFMHDGLLSVFLSNVPSVKLIMRSAIYLPRTTSPAVVQRKTVYSTNMEESIIVIPCIVHFVFGMSDDEKDRFFNMQQYLAVKAARDFLQPETIYVHYTYEPLGSWWELAKDFVTPNKVRNVMNIFNHSVHHFAHKADIIRLEVLLQYGGVYFDLDVWVYRDIRFLLTSGHEFIMGQEGENGAVGLCNAIIISHKDSKFLKMWYDAYQHFSEKSWNEFSVQLPNRMAAQHPSWVHVLPHTAFFWPMWDSNGLTRLYLSQDCPWFQMGYAVHLWSSKARSMIDELGTQSLYQYDSCFFQLARKIYYGNGDRKQQLSSSSSLFLKGSHELSEETSNQKKGAEMSEIVIGVLVFSLEELETVRNSWMTAALEFGIHCYFYTSSVSLAEEYSALIKMRKSRDEVPLTVLKPQFAPSPDPTSREWVSSHMLAHLFDNNKGKGMKWFVKVEADTFLRPDALRNTLSQYDSNEPTYLGSVTEFHGHRQTSDQMKTGEYIRLRYAQGHFYAMSSSAMKGIRPKLIECITDLWEEDKALARCLRKYLDLQPSDVSSSSVPIHVIPVSDRFHQLAYHGMDGLAMVGLARTLYGSHSVVVPALSEAGYQEMNHFDTENTKVKSVSFLSDPNDFRRHDVLYNRGAVLSYWQDQCFASGEVCGWKEITRTDCLAIGCCYKDEFSALFSPCMKPEGGTFQTENQLRVKQAKGKNETTTTTIAVASTSLSSSTSSFSSSVGETICAKVPFVIVSSEKARKKFFQSTTDGTGTSPASTAHSSLLETLLLLYFNSMRFLSCDSQLAKCISFQTRRQNDNQCTELIATKDSACLESVAVSTACSVEFLPHRVMNLTSSVRKSHKRASSSGGGLSEITSAITNAFRSSVSSGHTYGKNLETMTDRLIHFFKRKLGGIDASSLRIMQSISLSNKAGFTFLNNKNYFLNNNEFQINCMQYNPYLTEPGLLLCAFGENNSEFSEIPEPVRFQHQVSS